MLYDPKIMINNLDFKPKTFTSLNSYSTNAASTNPTIFKITKNAVQNSIELKSKIITYQNNSPNQLYNLINAQTKNISTLTHQMILLKTEIKNFHTINEILNKHHKTKKT